ncbi:hypothetical protein QR680_000962 [Steinernema hermaphroditum]|uniref:Uncharacterized protein n=1 Tax=Steinernema hermaphroditum TaxID=289476 RepID=A0AA39GZ98_9BILA|nr:hypothetical protein QR680_000962 [Steinernema hermaphroditum]
MATAASSPSCQRQNGFYDALLRKGSMGKQAPYTDRVLRTAFCKRCAQNILPCHLYGNVLYAGSCQTVIYEIYAHNRSVLGAAPCSAYGNRSTFPHCERGTKDPPPGTVSALQSEPPLAVRFFFTFRFFRIGTSLTVLSVSVTMGDRTAKNGLLPKGDDSVSRCIVAAYEEEMIVLMLDGDTLIPAKREEVLPQVDVNNDDPAEKVMTDVDGKGFAAPDKEYLMADLDGPGFIPVEKNYLLAEKVSVTKQRTLTFDDSIELAPIHVGNVIHPAGEHGLPNANQTKPNPLKRFFKNYLWEGQHLEEGVANVHSNSNDSKAPFVDRYRKYIGFLIPFAFMHFFWWTLAIKYNIFRLYPTHIAMPVTMIFGATVAGMTSEGGGAVAFPVMTLLLNIDSSTARDFSLMIQSCGMTSAAFTIVYMRIAIEWHSVVFCSIGSTAGIIVGLEYMDGLLTGDEKKMLFVSVWFSFAVALFILNRDHDRRTFASVPLFNFKKTLILLFTGFVGGLCSSFAGSGVDICSFSVLTLLFRVSEKIATPTSVVLMAVNTCFGFFWRQLIMEDIGQEAWDHFVCSVPVVVFFAPFGSFLSSHFNRMSLAWIVYILEGLALVGFLVTGPRLILIGIGSLIIAAGFVGFSILSKMGSRLAESVDPSMAEDGHLIEERPEADAGEAV